MIMAKGIIYVMTTVVPGLIKIGKTGTKNYEDRMYQLERNGYSNVVGLKRHYAIEVEDYDEKEILLDDIFSKSRLDNTELFALDEDLVVQLLSSFEGRQVYPENETKKEEFIEAKEKRSFNLIPDGIYTMTFRNAKAQMKKEDNRFILLKGSKLNEEYGWMAEGYKFARDQAAKDENLVLLEDIECKSPTMAASIVKGREANGWSKWKNSHGEFIDIYRKRR